MKTVNRTISIGDIHGCSIALNTLIKAINPKPQDRIVTLGDVIDWGPNSRSVLEQLIQLGKRCHLIPLLGNHEEMLLKARSSQSEFIYWTQYGGLDTLDSYGKRSIWDDIPAAHYQFLESCQSFHEADHHIFVHANFDPTLPMPKQPDQLLRWEHIDPTKSRQHISRKTVILGHTPQKSGEILDLGSVVCIDTFCHGGGWLTALDVLTGKIWQSNQQGELREIQHEPKESKL